MSLRGALKRTMLEDLEQDERVLERLPERSVAYGNIAQRDLVEGITNGVLEGMRRHGILERHREETNIRVDPPDLQPILDAIARVGRRHEEMLDLSNKHKEMLEAGTNIAIHPPDLREIFRAIEHLNSKHAETLKALARIEAPDLTPIRKAINNIVIDPPDLTQIFRAIEHLNTKQAETLQALASFEIEATDLTPILKAIAKIKPEVADHTPIARELKHLNVDGRHAELLQAISAKNAHPDFSHMEKLTQDLRSELRQTRHDFDALRQEIHENRKDARSDAERLMGEINDLPQVLGEIRQALRKLDQKVDFTELLQGVRKIREEVDTTGIMQQIKRLAPDPQATASNIAKDVCDRLSRASLNGNNDDVLKEFRRYAQKMPDMDQLVKTLKVGYREIAGETNERFEQSHAELLHAMKKMDVKEKSAISSADVDFNSIHEAIKNIDLMVDHTPLIEAIRSIKLPDHEAIADTVHDRLRRTELFSDLSEVLKEIRNTRSPDLESVLNAIKSAETKLSPVHEAVKRIHVPDHNMIAGAVHERLAQGLPDHNELIKEIRKTTANIDHNPVLQAVANLRAEIIANRGIELKEAKPTQTLSPRQAVHTLPTTPLIPMMPATIAPIAIARAPSSVSAPLLRDPKVLASYTRETMSDPLLRSTESVDARSPTRQSPVSTTIVREPKVIASYTREAVLDPLVRSTENVDGRSPTRQHFQKQPSPQAVGESARLPTAVYPKTLGEHVTVPMTGQNSYGAKVSQMELSASPKMQPTARPVELVEVELIEGQSPPLRSRSPSSNEPTYRHTTQPRYDNARSHSASK